jgi:hypothetical protein
VNPSRNHEFNAGSGSNFEYECYSVICDSQGCVQGAARPNCHTLTLSLGTPGNALTAGSDSHRTASLSSLTTGPCCTSSPSCGRCASAFRCTSLSSSRRPATYHTKSASSKSFPEREISLTPIWTRFSTSLCLSLSTAQW